MADAERLDLELSRFWNELVQPGLAPRKGDVPAEEAETLLRLHRMTQAPLPDRTQALVDRAAFPRLVIPPAPPPRDHFALRDAWQSDIVARGHAGQASPGRLAPFVAAGPPLALPSAAGRSRWPALPYATALLVLLTIGLVVATHGASRLVHETPSLIPAIQGVPEAETLFEITLPPEALPHGDRVSAGLDDYSLAPGEEADWEPAGACCPGLRLTYVMGGSLAMSSEATAHLLRAGMSLSPEIVPAGANVVLGPGDAFVSQFDEAFISSNLGQEPARFLDITVIDGFHPLYSAPEGWVWHPDGDVKYGMTVPEQPATFRLDRVVLEPGATLHPPPGAYTQLGVTIADNQPLDACGKDSVRNINDTPITVHVATLLPTGAIPLPAGPPEPDPLCPGGMPLSGEASPETIFAAPLPEPMVPAAGNLDFLVWRTALPSHTRTTSRAQIPGFQLHHVLEGELTLTAERSLQLYRSGETLGVVSGAEVPPGTPIVLHPGDTVVFPFDQKITYDNRSSTPVQLVGGGLFSGHGGWFPEAFTLIDYNEQYPVDKLPPGPVQVSLARATLPPEGEIPAPPAGSLVFDVGAVKESDIAKRMDGSLRNIGPEVAAIYVLTLTPLGEGHAPQGSGGFGP